jgi:hypothetical protein
VQDANLVTFGERVLELLDHAAVVTTYKYAVLLALMDLCIEGKQRRGCLPDSVTTRQLAVRVVELYWRQTGKFGRSDLPYVAGRQATIIGAIRRFRSELPDPSAPLPRAIAQSRGRYLRMLDQVEWTLIHMPLPRLQTLRGQPERLLFEIRWDETVRRSVVSQYQRQFATRKETRAAAVEATGEFDNQVRLLPLVGDHLVALNALLRPLIQRAWVGMVAQLNGLEESRLERFLFGTDRKALGVVRSPLSKLQDGKCFYCRNRIDDKSEVDHFVPWVRYADDGIENLVLSHTHCNNAKRDFLAARVHVSNWLDRNAAHSTALAELAGTCGLESHPEDTLGVARGIYFHIAPGSRLWLTGRQFCNHSPGDFHDLLG